MRVRRIGLIGFGAIARTAVEAVRRERRDVEIAGVLLRPNSASVKRLPEGCVAVQRPEDLAELAPDGIFECAGHEAVRDHAAAILALGRSFATVSAGALADPALLGRLQQVTQSFGGTLSLLPGAMAGLEALAAARLGGLERVEHTIVKPPAAWKATPAEKLIDLDGLSEATAFFQGSAGEAARAYPKNANVTAAVALAGLGFDKTRSVLVADPEARRNLHRLVAAGVFGSLSVEIEGHPLPDAPKTSMLAGLSVARAMAATGAGIHI